MIVVPDASVLLKWVLRSPDELDTEKALLLRQAAVSGAVTVVVPRLWLYEVGNTLTRRFPTQAESLLGAVLDFGLTEARRSTRWLRQAVSLATQYGVTFYDAAYHATALVGDPLAMAGNLGESDVLDQALTEFARLTQTGTSAT